MRICLLTSSYPVDENDVAAPFVPEFAQALRDKGHPVIVFTPFKHGSPVGWNQDKSVYWFRWMAGRKRVVDLKFSSPIDVLRMVSLLWFGVRQLLTVAKECEFDACMALWAIPSGYLARVAKQKLGIPYAVWALGSDINSWARYPVVGSVVRNILQSADALFADGFDLCRKVTSLAGRDCRYLSSARQLNLQRAIPPQFTEGRIHFLFIGRWEKVKGIDVLLEAWRRLTYVIDHDSADLTVLGGGSLEAELVRFVANNKLQDSVKFVPNAPVGMLMGYLKGANCIVIPSRSESIPLVFSEAIQANLPSIVSDVGDMGMLAHEYGVGRVVPAENPEAVELAMLEFIRMGQLPSPRRQELLDLMELKTSAARYLDTLNEIVTRRKGSI